MSAAVLDEATPARGPGQDFNYKHQSSYGLLPKTYTVLAFIIYYIQTLHYVLHPFATC